MLSDTYRPATWDTFIGNERVIASAKAMCQRMIEARKGQAVWIDGPSGTGKTTLAMLMANHLGVKDWDRISYDAGTVDQAAVKDIRRIMQLCPSGPFRHIQIDEAHAMTSGAVQGLLTVLEPLHGRNLITFTTTEGRKADIFGGFDGPLKSRCIPFSLSNQGLAQAFADRAVQIADEIGMGGIDSKKALRIVQEEKTNLRKVIMRIEAGDFLTA